MSEIQEHYHQAIRMHYLPDGDNEIWQLIQHTKIGGFVRLHWANDKFCWIKYVNDKKLGFQFTKTANPCILKFKKSKLAIEIEIICREWKTLLITTSNVKNPIKQEHER